MLLNIFKSKQPVTLIIIFLFTFLLWFNPFANQQILFDDSINGMPLFTSMRTIIPAGSLFSKLLGFAFVVSIALLIIRLNIKYSFFAERSYLPAVIYVTLVVGIANVHDFYSFMPATVLFIFAINRLLQTYKTDNLSYRIFDAAFILGISTLFYLNSIFYMFFIWIALLILRPFYWREWFFSILGILVPLFIVVSLYILLDWKFPAPKIEFSNKIWSVKNINFSVIQYLFFAAILILMIVSSQFLIRAISNKKIFTRKTYNLFLVVFILSLAMFFIFKTASTEIAGFASISLTILFSHYFLQARHNRWMDLLFYLYLGTFLLTQLIPF